MCLILTKLNNSTYSRNIFNQLYWYRGVFEKHEQLHAIEIISKSYFLFISNIKFFKVQFVFIVLFNCYMKSSMIVP